MTTLSTRLAALALATAGLAACSDTAPPTAAAPVTEKEEQQPTAAAAGGQVIPGRYIVTLSGTSAGDSAEVPAIARRLVGKGGGRVRLAYARALRGFVADMSESAAAEMARTPGVAAVEPDRWVSLGTVQSAVTWGLDRVDQRAMPYSGTFTYTSTGAGVRVYVIDSGIESTHPEFGGRALNVYDGIDPTGTGEDCNGHGTHVAGTIGSESYGVAKGVALRGVRVFGCTNTTANSTIIAGVDYVTRNHIKPAVANLSISGSYSSALNAAVMNLVSAGVFVTVAAGNENTFACNRSPASASTATTVAATTSSDTRASYSNYGSCVDLYAPGSDIASTYLGASSALMSGTSMAAPHVAGVAALYKSTFGDAAQPTIDSWLKTKSTVGAVKSNVTGTPNKLLFKAAL